MSKWVRAPMSGRGPLPAIMTASANMRRRRRGRSHRIEQRVGGAGHGRRACGRRRRQRDHPGRGGGRPGGGEGTASGEARLGKPVPAQTQKLKQSRRSTCGIIGILGRQPAAPLLVDGLKRLAYRGDDFAGVATLVNGHIDRRRAEGKLTNLEALLAQLAAAGSSRDWPYPLGDPWPAERDQRPSPCHRPCRRRA